MHPCPIPERLTTQIQFIQAISILTMVGPKYLQLWETNMRQNNRKDLISKKSMKLHNTNLHFLDRGSTNIQNSNTMIARFMRSRS